MEPRIFGYARVSSREQNLDRQILKLREYVPEANILTDKASGKDLNRPSYMALKGRLGLRAGDTLVITSLDRLSRDKNDMKNELQWFKEQDIRLKVLDLPSTLVEVADGQKWIIEMINNILIEVLSSIAEQERLTTKARQRERIEAAKKKGKHLGRPKNKMPECFPFVYSEWKSGAITTKEAMRKLNMKSTSFYRMVNEYEEKSNVPKSQMILVEIPK